MRQEKLPKSSVSSSNKVAGSNRCPFVWEQHFPRFCSDYSPANLLDVRDVNGKNLCLLSVSVSERQQQPWHTSEEWMGLTESICSITWVSPECQALRQASIFISFYYAAWNRMLPVSLLKLVDWVNTSHLHLQSDLSIWPSKGFPGCGKSSGWKINKRTHQSEVCVPSESSNRMKCWTDWEKCPLATLSDKGLVPKVYKEFRNTKSR